MKKSLAASIVLLLPFLCALYPVVYLFSRNAAEASLAEFGLTIFGVLIFTAVLFPLFFAFLRSWTKASLCLSVFVLAVFSYGHFYHFVRDAEAGGLEFGRHRFLVPLLFFLMAVWIWRIRRSQADYRPAVKRGAAIIALITVVSFTGASFSQARQGMTGQGPLLSGAEAAPPLADAEKRDIYFLVFDRYASHEVLKKYYGYDNSAFLNALRERGFVIPGNSRANYLKSEHSLASTLNLKHLDRFSAPLENSESMKPLHGLIRNFELLRFLQQHGYRYVHAGSWWEPTSQNPYADENINRMLLPEFTREFLEMTAFYPLIPEDNILNGDKEQWERVHYKFDKLAKAGGRYQEPVFVFAHFLVPHFPYVFNRDGSYLSEEEAAERPEKKKYLDQIEFVNGEILELIDRIQKERRGGPEPVIILQADEGPYPARYQKDPENFSWRGATPEELDEKTGILNAFYLPDTNEFPEKLAPVNTFRYILNIYFRTELDFLPDHIYAFENRKNPYRLFNVTRRLQWQRAIMQ